MVSVSSFWLFHHDQSAQWQQIHARILSGIAALASFRAFDLFINAAAYAPFGPEGWGGRSRNRDEHCRVMLLTLMNFVELISWYSVLFAYLAWFCGAKFIYPGYDMRPVQPFMAQHALLLAMSTITTVGYGTVAPDDMLTTIVVVFETMSGLLLIAVGIASAVSLAVVSPQSATLSEQHPAVRSKPSSSSWRIRSFSPLICSAG